MVNNLLRNKPRIGDTFIGGLVNEFNSLVVVQILFLSESHVVATPLSVRGIISETIFRIFRIRLFFLFV